MASSSQALALNVEKLTGSNYRSWKFNMKMLLIERGLWECVINEETIDADEDQRKYEKTKIKQEKALATIALSISTEQQIHVIDCKTASEAWTTLEQIFEPKSRARILQLKKQFVNIKFIEEENMINYLSRLKTCSDHLREAGCEVNDEDLAYSMLAGLPDSYDGIIMNFGNMTDDEFTSSKVRQVLLTEHERRTTRKEDLSKELLQVNQHQNNSSTDSRRKCYRCGKIGHIATNYRGMRQTTTRNRDNQHFQRKVNKSDNFLAALNLTSDEDSWQLDSGATNHVCRNKDWFVDLREVSSDPIMTASGTTEAKGYGHIFLQTSIHNECLEIKLNNVLYVPNVRRNLLSVSKIEENSNRVTFRNMVARVFNPENRIIAEATNVNGLYIVKGKTLNSSKTAFNSEGDHFQNISLRTWHQSLCHIDSNAIEKMAREELVIGLEISSRDKGLCDVVVSLNPLKHKVPDGLWLERNPSVRHLKAFGCLAYSHIPRERRRKLDNRACRCILVGYSTQTRGYRLWCPGSQKVIETKHVRFDESKIGLEWTKRDEETEPERYNHVWLEPETNYDNDLENELPSNLDSVGVEDTLPQPSTSKNIVRNPYGRKGKPRVELNFLDVTEPQSFEEAVQSPEAMYWRKAMEDELRVLQERGTWELSTLPPGKKPISSRWVYKVKTNESGNVERFKARLVARGFSQKQGIDFQETYAPVISLAVIRVLITLSLNMKWYNRHLDVDNAYLYGDLEEEIYMLLPEGVERKDNEHNTTMLASFSRVECRGDESTPGPPLCTGGYPQVFPGRIFEDSPLGYGALFVFVHSRSSGLDSCSTYLVESKGIKHELTTPYTPRSNGRVEIANRTLLDKGRTLMADSQLPLHFWAEAVNTAAYLYNLTPITNDPDTTPMEKWKEHVLASSMVTGPRPVNAKVVKSKWVFKISKDQENKNKNYNARLVAMGYNQIPGRDYNESFSPVIKIATLRTILSMAATKDSVIKLFDVKAAYLNGNIENTILMEQPVGFVKDRNKVCKLNKSIYGLPQSGRSWYEKFSRVLHDCGLEKLKSDLLRDQARILTRLAAPVWRREPAETGSRQFALVSAASGGLTPQDDAKNLDKVIEAFDNHFIGKRNVVYERALFGLRSQRPEETIEEFVTVLHRISEHCEYANLREELIRDRLVLGVKDRKLSEKRMLNENLTLAKAVEIARQWEAVMREQQDLNPSTSQPTLGSRKSRWKSTVRVNGTAIHFKLDPGSDVTLIPFSLYKRYFSNVQLAPTDGQLMAAAKQRLENAGTFVAKLRANTREMKETVYVVHHLEQPLLGVRACEDLQLVKRIDLVINGTMDVNPEREFPKLFEGLGLLEQPYHIKLKEGAKPFSIPVPRRVPLPLMPKLKEQLDAMVAQEVIEPVDEPTEWCAPIVLSGKPNGKIRICVDLSRLNLSVERKLHPLPVLEHELAQLNGAKIFSRLDANSGFWQIKLSEESQTLTTFITPFGRYKFKRLPFGISSAPEHFQKRISAILRGVNGVICHMDDILIFAKRKEEHDETLREVLRRLKNSGITLNKEKCQFGVSNVTFLGHYIDEHGIKADEKKVKAIAEMKPPNDVHGVQRFMGMVNFLGRFVPNLAEITKPLNDLRKKDVSFIWGSPQKKAFEKVKDVLASDRVLANFDIVNRQKNCYKSMVSADASSYGLGAVLKQEHEANEWRPVAFASRTLTKTEQGYAQIEKEALSITWACERFKDFVVGKTFLIETDHKPLVPIFTTKDLNDLTPRLQRYRMRMLQFSFHIFHTPGKDLITADALSRQPLPGHLPKDEELQEEVEHFVRSIVLHQSTTDDRLAKIALNQKLEPILQNVAFYFNNGWPAKCQLSPLERSFYEVRDEIGEENGLLMRGLRVIIPSNMRKDDLNRIHAGHQGITKCRARAKDHVWWPGVGQEIQDMVKTCEKCIENQPLKHEPLIPNDFPERPWQKVEMDLFHYEGNEYLVVVDYFSRFIEVVRLTKLSSEAVVDHCKAIFARHGIPDIVISDNGPQFRPSTTSAFTKFASEVGFWHITSSPKHPQSNGQAEAAVKIVKNLMKKNKDLVLALMEYRATPLANGLSPAELLFGRKIRTMVPCTSLSLTPKTVDQSKLRGEEEQRKMAQKTAFDRRHAATKKAELIVGEKVWVEDPRAWGSVLEKASAPRSYIVETPVGTYRRNSLLLASSQQQVEPSETSPDSELPAETEETPGNDLPAEELQQLPAIAPEIKQLSPSPGKVSRPDIAYITSKPSQHFRQPKQMHWTAIKRVMRYLRGTIDLGVKFERGKTGILKSYTDASWSTTHDGKSYGGYVLKLGEATIDWKSSKQPLVALSTMEAEMIAACESCCQIKWIIKLLRELEEWNFMEKPTAIYTDSQSLINWISSPKQSSRCRHINRKYHFLRDCYESRDICLLCTLVISGPGGGYLHKGPIPRPDEETPEEPQHRGNKDK
ncbi:K02A2.6-like, partial [Cordylochernes scorpioides]